MPKFQLTPEQHQRILHALSDPTRYDILQRVFASKAALTCANAKGELSISDATCSHHVKELVTAELIDMTRAGRHRLLTPRKEVWKAFLRELKDV